MSKSYKKRVREEDYEEFDEYGDLKSRSIDKRKKRRFTRALKTMDINELMEMEDSTEFGP